MSAVSIIGVHDGHNSAAARLDDGKITGAVQEERFTRAKNQGDVPHRSIEWLLRHGGGTPEYLAVNGKYMVYGEWSRDVVLSLFEASEGVVTRIKQHLKSTPIDHLYLSRKEGERFSAFDRTFLGAIPNHVAVEHHLAHASAAYFGSGWCDSEPVLLLTCDGTGDRLSGTVSIGQNGEISRIAGIDENDSLGQIYAVVTYIMGMLPLEHEYKVMGLAPYVQGGQARKDLFEGILEFDKSGLTWRRKSGIPPLFASTEFFRERLKRARFDHISASVQSFAEEMLTTWARNCVRHTGIRRVACSGGVFMNVKANQVLFCGLVLLHLCWLVSHFITQFLPIGCMMQVIGAR